MTVDATATLYPLAKLADIPPGRYAVQAALDSNPDSAEIDAPGNLYSTPRLIDIDPARDEIISLELDQAEPPETLPEDSPQVRYLKVHSDLLSAFHGRPMFLRVGVILPAGFEDEPDRAYPLRVDVGGFGSRYTGVRRMMGEGSRFRTMWEADDTPRFVILHLDGDGPLGDPYQVNSANHGPYGDAVTQELIPLIEKQFRCGGPGRRVVTGGSTGGWVSFALQVFYPDFFAGCWSFCPDPVDFRSYQLVNIYEDKNAYVAPDGADRASARDPQTGKTEFTIREECGLENLRGTGGSYTMSGGQWGAWNATFSPRGADGRPVPLWDPVTGQINPQAAEQWTAYDLRMHLEANWATLGPKLRGKIHIWVGDADDYFLNEAVEKLEAFFDKANPPYEGSIVYGPGQGHCWQGISQIEMLRQMAEATATTP